MSIVMKIGIPTTLKHLTAEEVRQAIETQLFSPTTAFVTITENETRYLRVDPQTHSSISKLSDETGETMTSITANIIQAYAEMSDERIQKAKELTEQLRDLGYEVEITGHSLKEDNDNGSN